MNVFEDLVVELKEENLLEKTIIDREIAQNGNTPGERSETEVEPMVEPDAELHAEASTETADNETDTSMDAEQWEGDKTVDETAVADPVPMRLKQKNSSEFFKKRAVDEVASLQMVEHVLTGVEREFMQIVPKSFDDFNTKRALHAF